MIRLTRVIDALPEGLAALRDEARAEGHSMLDTLAAEWETRKTRFDRPGEALVAGYSDDILAGIGGVTVEPVTASAFRMRRFYVRAAFRRSGVARQLALALLDGAASPGRVFTANAAAGSEAFWESLGFAPDKREGHTHILTLK
jgi:GNAT superfamily N-acetyltransferase